MRFDNYYLESSLYTERPRRARPSQRLVAAGKTYEQDGALWLRTTDYGDDKDRVMRKSDGTLHLLRARRRLPRRPSASAASPRSINVQGTDHHGTIARVRAGLQAAGVGIPAGYPGLRAAQDGHA